MSRGVMAEAPSQLPAEEATGAPRQRQRRSRWQAEEVRASVEVQGFQAVYASPAVSPCRPPARPSACRSTRCQLDPALTVRTVPKRDEKAYLYAKLTIARGTPILPGPVSLFRDATFVGNGRLPLLAPGEEHELGFGVDDAVRVRHAIAEEKRGESGIITSSKTDTRNYRITVKNLHERADPAGGARPGAGVAERRHQGRADSARRRPPSATSTTSAAWWPGR